MTITAETPLTHPLAPRGPLGDNRPADPEPQDPENRARQIGERIKAFKLQLHKLAMEYVAIGEALGELKGELTAGHNGSREGTVYTGRGWQAMCKECVGISYKTADRYIHDAECYRVLKESAEANPRLREYLDLVERGEVRAAKALEAAENFAAAKAPETDPSTWASLHETLDPGTPKVWLREMEQAALAGDELAARQLARAAAGEIRMGAAYSGWQGGEATRGKTRRDPDPARIIVNSAASINKYWAKLDQLDIERRRVVTDTFLALMSGETMPEEIARESYRILKARFES